MFQIFLFDLKRFIDLFKQVGDKQLCIIHYRCTYQRYEYAVKPALSDPLFHKKFLYIIRYGTEPALLQQPVAHLFKLGFELTDLTEKCFFFIFRFCPKRLCTERLLHKKLFGYGNDHFGTQFVIFILHLLCRDDPDIGTVFFHRLFIRTFRIGGYKCFIDHHLTFSFIIDRGISTDALCIHAGCGSVSSLLSIVISS